MTEVHSPIAGGGDNCPQCSSSLAKDQRYCLACGSRRGDPRLPFMDAVVFMDAVKQPQSRGESEGPDASPAPSKRPLLSANASLVAGVATLVLAIGVGVLIGRSGDSGTQTAQAPQVIRVGGSGGGGEVEEGASAEGGKGKKEAKSSSTPKTAKKKAKAKTETGSSGTSKATEEVFKPAAGANLPEVTTQVGEKCNKKVAGCSKNGEFDGSFFEE